MYNELSIERDVFWISITISVHVGACTGGDVLPRETTQDISGKVEFVLS
uniref:Uncharacterized protein n=1 Tax=Arundo donax TaxID=35708 RepID=A0A0A9C338_ARUDO